MKLEGAGGRGSPREGAGGRGRAREGAGAENRGEMGQRRDAVCAKSRKWGKGNHPKVNEIQGFLYLGHSNWTICSLLS